MFTGIVEAVGELQSIASRGRGYEVMVKTPESFDLEKRVRLGDSIATNGVCLTATKIVGDCYFADLSAETARCTCFGSYKTGQKLNLELACTPSTRLGGHIMQGHVDGIGRISSCRTLDEAYDIWVAAPHVISRYIATKGSIAVDGVSLTVNEVVGDTFRLTLIPHTQNGINFENFKTGSQVNLEVDVLSRYLERLLACKDGSEENSNLASVLSKNGFI